MITKTSKKNRTAKIPRENRWGNTANIGDVVYVYEKQETGYWGRKEYSRGWCSRPVDTSSYQSGSIIPRVNNSGQYIVTDIYYDDHYNKMINVKKRRIKNECSTVDFKPPVYTGTE